MCKGGELRMAPILHGVFLVRWDTGLFTGLKEFHWLSVFWAQFRMLVMAFKTLNAPGAWDLKDLLAIKSIKWGPSWDATTGRRKDSEYPWEVFLMAVPRSCGIPSHWKLERPPHSLLLDGNKNILFFSYVSFKLLVVYFILCFYLLLGLLFCQWILISASLVVFLGSWLILWFYCFFKAWYLK